MGNEFRRIAKTADEVDAYGSWRHVLCYLGRPGVASKIKRSTNHRERRELKDELAAELKVPYSRPEGEDFCDPEVGAAAESSHPYFEGERCGDCGTNVYDSWLYGIFCNPDREPVVYTTETEA